MITDTTHRISVDFDKLEVDAQDAATHHLRVAIHEVEKALNERADVFTHPELITAFMAVAAQESRAVYQKLAAQDIGDGLHAIADAITGLTEALRKQRS